MRLDLRAIEPIEESTYHVTLYDEAEGTTQDTTCRISNGPGGIWLVQPDPDVFMTRPDNVRRWTADDIRDFNAAVISYHRSQLLTATVP